MCLCTGKNHPYAVEIRPEATVSGHGIVASLQCDVAPDNPSATSQKMPCLQFMLGGFEIKYEGLAGDQHRGKARRFGSGIISKIHEQRAILDSLQMFDVLFIAHVPASAVIRTKKSQQTQHVLATGRLVGLHIRELRLKKLQQHTRAGCGISGVQEEPARDFAGLRRGDGRGCPQGENTAPLRAPICGIGPASTVVAACFVLFRVHYCRVVSRSTPRLRRVNAATAQAGTVRYGA
jgi:hypothetical protein